MQPYRRHTVNDSFADVLEWTTSLDDQMKVTLGGSCALAEFYGGYREPADIDLFVNQQSDMDELDRQLKQRFEVLGTKPEKEPTSLQYALKALGQPVTVHSVCLREWKCESVRVRYTKHVDGMRVHTLPFIGLWKLEWTISDPPIENAKTVLDLFSLRQAGLVVEELVQAYREIRGDPVEELSPWPYKLPDCDLQAINALPVLIPVPGCLLREFVQSFADRVKDAFRSG